MRKLPRWQQIFVNRSLNMRSIKSVGFDLDHTLAVYRRDEFENLAFQETLKKMIQQGYPEELSTLEFNPDFLIRGLLVDVHRGNLLKVDGHKYVKLAFHGTHKLTKQERHSLYNSESFDASKCVSVDTFFSLSEVQLFVNIVDYMGKNPSKIQKDFEQVYKDIKKAIDVSHKDGSIKTKVLAEPERFIQRDKYLLRTLLHLINGDKSLFLLTNSHWDYTKEILNFLFEERCEEIGHWRDVFDYIITGAGKPGFFRNFQPFYEVMPDTNLLQTTSESLVHGKVYHGGCAKVFQDHTGFRGDEILYVGDHIYGDISRSKDLFNWRTMLVIEELDQELKSLKELSKLLNEVSRKLIVREVLDEEVQRVQSKIFANTRLQDKAGSRQDRKKSQYLSKENTKLVEMLEQKQLQLSKVEKETKELIRERDNKLHPVWGELMKVGLERSRFANQVVEYACLYTSRVSNIRFYSTAKTFSSNLELMPHDFIEPSQSVLDEVKESVLAKES